jgi:hypothetical protein
VIDVNRNPDSTSHKTARIEQNNEQKRREAEVAQLAEQQLLRIERLEQQREQDKEKMEGKVFYLHEKIREVAAHYGNAPGHHDREMENGTEGVGDVAAAGTDHAVSELEGGKAVILPGVSTTRSGGKVDEGGDGGKSPPSLTVSSSPRLNVVLPSVCQACDCPMIAEGALL